MEENICNIWKTEAKYAWIYKDLLEIVKSHKAIEKKMGKWYTQAIQNRRKKDRQTINIRNDSWTWQEKETF